MTKKWMLNHLCFIILLIPGVASAQVIGQYYSAILQSGHSYDDSSNSFVFRDLLLEHYAWQYALCSGTLFKFSCPVDAIHTSPPEGNAVVKFSTDRKTMQLSTFVINLLPLRHEAHAGGVIYTNFCIEGDTPNSCTSSTETAEAATVTFTVSWAGRLYTFGPTATSSFKLDCEIYDEKDGTDPNHARLVAFKQLVNTSTGNLFGQWKTVAGVPIPLPSTAGVTKSEPVAFNVSLSTNHIYKFQCRGLSTANTDGGLYSINARSNFNDPLSLGGQNWSGARVENFSVNVAPSYADVQKEISTLVSQIESLQKSLGDLSDKIDSNSAELVDQINAIRQTNDALTGRVEALETQQQASNDEISVLQGQMATLSKLIAAMQHHP